MSGRGWLLTFADLAALLFAFFALALAMTRPESWTWRDPPPAGTPVTGTGAEGASTQVKGTRFAYLAGLVASAVRAWPGSCRPRVARTGGALVLRWADPAVTTSRCAGPLTRDGPRLAALAAAASEVVLARHRIGPVVPEAVDWAALDGAAARLARHLGRMPLRLVVPDDRPALVLTFRGGTG